MEELLSEVACEIKDFSDQIGLRIIHAVSGKVGCGIAKCLPQQCPTRLRDVRGRKVVINTLGFWDAS